MAPGSPHMPRSRSLRARRRRRLLHHRLPLSSSPFSSSGHLASFPSFFLSFERVFNLFLWGFQQKKTKEEEEEEKRKFNNKE